MQTLASLVALFGFALLLAGSVFFLVAAFRESLLWGLGTLLLPVVSLVFLIVHWPRAKNSFFLQLYGVGFVLVAALALHAHIPWWSAHMSR